MNKILYLSFVELDIPNACQTHTIGVIAGFGKNEQLVDAILPRPIKIMSKIDNVRFYYIWPWGFSRIGKACFKLLSTFVMLFLCMKNKYMAIYVREMEVNPGPRLCSKLFKIPFYIEINDLIVPVLTENGVQSSLVQRVSRHQELDFKQSSGLIIPSVPMCNWIIDQYGLPKTKVHMIINGTDLAEAPKSSSIHAKRKLGLTSDCFCLGFVGNIYDRYDFNTIFKAIIECVNHISNLNFIIVGEGPFTSEVKAMTDRYGLEDCTIFTGYIQPDKLGEILPALDIGLLCLTKKNALRYGPITTKLSTYAMYKLSVISLGYTLKNYPSVLVQNIYLVPPENHYALANKIIQLYNNSKDRKQKAEKLQKYVSENMTWNAITKKILEIITHDNKPE